MIPSVTTAVDVHAHFVPDGYGEALAQAGIPHPDGTPLPVWSASSHLETMDRLDIGTAVLSLSSPGVTPFGAEAAAWARRVNDEAAILVKAHPGRFAFFGTLPLPDVEAATAEAQRVLDELDGAGIVLLTHTAGIYLGAPVLDPLMQVLDARSAVVFVHPTSPVASEAVDQGRPAPFIEYLIDSSRAFVNLHATSVLQRYGSIRWIVAHNAALLPGLVDRVDLLGPALLPADDARGSFTEAAARLYYEVGSSAPFPHAAPAALAMTDPSHLLLGTDTPYAPMTAIEENVDALRAGRLVADAALDQLLADNARALLPGLHPHPAAGSARSSRG